MISHTVQQPQPASPVLTVPHDTVPCGPARKLVPQLGQSHRTTALPNLTQLPTSPCPHLQLHNSLATFPTQAGAPWAPCHQCSTQPDDLFHSWPLTLVPVNKDTATHQGHPAQEHQLVLLCFSTNSALKKKPEQTLQLARKCLQWKATDVAALQCLQPSNVSHHPGKEGSILLRLGKAQECLEMLSKSHA